MASHTCVCGAKYKFPDSAVGKKAKCKQCGATLVLGDESLPIAIAGEDAQALDVDAGHERAPAVDTSAIAASSAVSIPRSTAPAEESDSEPLAVAVRPSKGYFDSLLWTFLFISDPRNLLIFLILWAVVFFGSMLFGIFILLSLLGLIFYGWYFGFLFQIVESAAAGDEHLPEADLTDPYDDVVRPLFAWIGSWAVVYAPSVLYLFDVMRHVDRVRAFELFVSALSDPISTFPDEPMLVIMLYGGLFFWPIVVLTIALGGFGSLIQVDKILLTVGKTIGPYLLTVGLVYGTFAVDSLTGSSLAGRAASQGGGTTFGGMIVAQFFAAGASLYCDIVALRAIGLYYHHFKDRFAWDWG